MPEQINKVLAYYKSTNFDYEHFWSGKRALALHFGYYDEVTNSHEASLLKMNEVLTRIASIQPTDSIFDAGCGYGGSSIWLAENVGCKVLGMTLVPYQVNKAKHQAERSTASAKLHFVEGDYANTKLPNNSFDVVWGLESIVHCENKQAFVKEAFRSLKPGGRLIISEYLLRDNPPLSPQEHNRMKPFLEGWMMPDLFTPSQYKKVLTSVGFRKFKLHDLSANVEPSLKKCRHNSALALPFVGILRNLRLIDQIRKDYTIANYQLYDTFKDGLWRYQVVVGVKPK